jgi:hypothetical protein
MPQETLMIRSEFTSDQEGIKLRKFMFRCAGFTHRMIEEVDGYLFECSSPAGECSHWLSPDQYKRFLASIGQRPSNNLFPAVIASIRERGNKLTVVSAIHAIATSVFEQRHDGK